MYFFGYARNGFQNWFFRRFYNFSRSLTGGKIKTESIFFRINFVAFKKIHIIATLLKNSLVAQLVRAADC